jgi:hypothetical protein
MVDCRRVVPNGTTPKPLGFPNRRAANGSARPRLIPSHAGIRDLMTYTFIDVKHWQAHAEKVRIMAEQMDDEGREIMLKLAADYDRLTEWATQQLACDLGLDSLSRRKPIWFWAKIAPPLSR